MKEWFLDTGDPREAPRGTCIFLTFSKEWVHEIDEDSFRDGCSIKLKKNWVVYIAILMEELFNSRLRFFPLEMPRSGVLMSVLLLVYVMDAG